MNDQHEYSTCAQLWQVLPQVAHLAEYPSLSNQQPGSLRFRSQSCRELSHLLNESLWCTVYCMNSRKHYLLSITLHIQRTETWGGRRNPQQFHLKGRDTSSWHAGRRCTPCSSGWLSDSDNNTTVWDHFHPRASQIQCVTLTIQEGHFRWS